VDVNPSPREAPPHPHDPAADPRRATQILDRYAHEVDDGDDDNTTMQERMAAGLRNAKDMGIASPDMIEHATAQPGLNPYAVSELPMSIQMGFRRKMLSILLLQQCFTIGLAFVLRFTPVLRDALEFLFPAQSIQALCLLLVTPCCLPLLSIIKHKHPHNLLCTLGWSVLFAITMAVTDLPGAFFKSHALFVIMVELAAGVLFMTLFSQMKWLYEDELGTVSEWRPISFGKAGFFSYCLWMPAAAITFSQLKDSSLSGITTGHFVAITIIATLVFMWISYDAYKLCCKMTPDEYLKGVIHFYTDMFYVCVCCCIITCLGSAGRG